jgi:hypothetical protein
VKELDLNLKTNKKNMRIKCVENKVAKLPEEIIKNYSISDSNFPILIGKEYVVYGMTVHLGYVWYYICDEIYSYYPTWSPSPLFEVIDGQLSRFWIYSYKEGMRTVLSPWWTFPEWADNPDFYDNLTDGDEREVKIFKSYKELMDLEFPDFTISEIAQIGDKEWLICPTCIDGWECLNTLDGMVRCPKCKKVMHNPRYQAEKSSPSRLQSK